MKRTWNEEKETYDYNFEPQELATIRLALDIARYASLSTRNRQHLRELELEMQRVGE